MATDKTRRCRHCGGTLWQDGDVVKCFACSRPVDGPSGADRIPTNFSHPKLPVKSNNKYGLKLGK